MDRESVHRYRVHGYGGFLHMEGSWIGRVDGWDY